ASDAIGMALNVTAIEALLGESGGEITHKLADAVAVLLEPWPEFRAHAAALMVECYKARSKVLHGDSLEASVERKNARLLAAGVLAAVINRREFMRSNGDPADSPEKLLK